MFDSLSEKLESAFKMLKGEGKITEINVADTLKEVRRQLVSADVNYKVANTFVKTVKEKALGQNVLKSVKPRELMIKIVYDELVDLMGRSKAPLNLAGNPTVILMSGLQGSGKTTFSGKLAKYLSSFRGKRPLLVAGDVYRPAAIEQLKVLGESIGVPVYSEDDVRDVVGIARRGIQFARDHHYDLVIIDTAGRLAVDEEMMDEIERVKNAVNPQETLFVVDSMTGQDAVNTARAFNERLDFDGVILTKLDGDTRGGAAISIRAVVTKPIKFVGTGEKLEDLQEFNPEGMASRILGQGDIQELVNRIQNVYDEEDARKMQEKIKKNKFDFEDFRHQINQIKKMGNLKSIASMIPGIGKALKDVDIPENAFKNIEAIIDSMTPYERRNPDVIDLSRRQRIARGSGTSLQEVNKLIKQFADTRKMMKNVAGMNPRKMQAQMAQLKRMQSKMR